MNEKRESRGIRQDKYNLTANRMMEELREDTSSVKALHINSYRITMRSYSEILQNLKVILSFAFTPRHIPYAISPLFSPSFSCSCLFCTYLLCPRWSIPLSSPETFLPAKISHLSNSSLKPTSSGNFHSLSKPDAFLALNIFSISSLVCLKTWISGSRGLSVIFFLETE